MCCLKQTFDIKIENKSSLDCKCTVQLDGTGCNWPIVYPQKTRLVEGVNAGEDGEVLPFVFCHIELTGMVTFPTLSGS
jgi:hypothetical protein